MSKIDVHAHVVPPLFREALQNAGGDPAGWHIPQWSAEKAIAVQEEMGVTTSVLSVTSPGCLFLNTEGNRDLARACNEYCAKLRVDHPGRFGFYVNLPDVHKDLEGALEEVKYGLDHLGADGVCLFPQYAGFYLGHPDFIPLWEELDRRKATILIHPTPPEGYKPMPAQKYCPCPAFDFPHETTRCVSDIVMSGRRQQFPAVSVVLCHGGGTIPFLADRIAYTTNAPALHNPLPAPEIIKQFKTFHYDTALCGTGPAFELTVAFVPQDKLVIGSDHPYAVPEAMYAFSRAVDERSWTEEEREQLYRTNAQLLFPGL